MKKRLFRFLARNRAGRGFVKLTHGVLYHRGITQPMRFRRGGCWLCNLVADAMVGMMGDSLRDAQADQSSVHVSDPVYDADGKLLRAGVSMSATAKRQLDALMADPEQAESIQHAIDEIASHPES